MNTQKYWITVVSKDHVMKGKAGGFMQANHGKAAPLKRMKDGDMVIFYSPKKEYGGEEKCQAFTAIGKIVGNTIYPYDMGGGFIPFRRAVEYQRCQEIPIQPLVPYLHFIENKERWGYLFKFGFFEIPKEDFDLLSSQMLNLQG